MVNWPSANGLTSFSLCKLTHNAAVIHKTVMSLCQHMCFWTIFVNKSLFAATKVDFQYFWHIFVWAPTRGKGLTITIIFSLDFYSIYKLWSQMLECCYLNKMWPKILGLRMGHNRKSILRPNLRSRLCQAIGIYFNIVDLCGILPYKRMYPYKCGIKINFDILTTQEDQ